MPTDLNWLNDEKPRGGAFPSNIGLASENLRCRRSRLPVTIDAARCLRSARSSVPCAKCVEACPIRAFEADEMAIEIAGECLGCAACAVACPAGAIHVNGFPPAPMAGDVLAIECARVPLLYHDRPCWVVPCLAGLTPAAIAEAMERHGRTRLSIKLIDRGLCRDCQLGGANRVAATEARLAEWFEGVEGAPISVERVADPIASKDARPPGSRPAASRRSFLAGFVDGAARDAALWPGILTERAILARLARRIGVSLDARHYPRLDVSPACTNNDICVANCPTGALRREVSGDAGEIRRLIFDPKSCLACARCEAVCPTQALAFLDRGEEGRPAAPVLLRETTWALCERCDGPFEPAPDETLCPVCRKGHSLFRDLSSASALSARAAAGYAQPNPVKETRHVL